MAPDISIFLGSYTWKGWNYLTSVLFLNYYKKFFNQFENIPPQNKDTEVVFVSKICLIRLFLSTL